MDCNRSESCRPFNEGKRCRPCSQVVIRYQSEHSRPQIRSKIRTLFPCHLTLQLKVSIVLTFALCSLLKAQQAFATDETPNSDDANNEVDSCEACRLVVKSFDKGMEETSRGKHEGGDTSWEERNLKSYTDSEVRLVEIQERLCEEVKTGKAQCLSLAEDAESDIEHWWFKQRNKNVRLFDYLCISKLKRCCPTGKFGPNCQPCQSDCNKHGVCDGMGTRQGTGDCNCESGYVGDECSQCAEDHFRVATSDHFTCRKCDSACKGCYGPGLTNCTECREGYYKHEVNGCVDINECDMGMDMNGDTRLCKGNQYCVNTDGAYRCADCHVSCAGCVGYGPDMCIKCARGYKLDDEYTCRSREEMDSIDEWGKDATEFRMHNPMARYFFYAGVLLVSILMFRSNLYVMYTFTLGFVVLLLLTEFDLFDGMQEYTKGMGFNCADEHL